MRSILKFSVVRVESCWGRRSGMRSGRQSSSSVLSASRSGYRLYAIKDNGLIGKGTTCPKEQQLRSTCREEPPYQKPSTTRLHSAESWGGEAATGPDSTRGDYYGPISSMKLPSGSRTVIRRKLFSREIGVSPIGFTPVLARRSKAASALRT
jgi:hypothetical protein